MKNRERIDRLNAEKQLPHTEWTALFTDWDEDDRAYAAELARGITTERFGNRVYFRGIIEFSNICKNDCYYCGIRKSNRSQTRYRLTREEILLCCREGWRLGYRTFVLQSGEDPWWTDERMTDLIAAIRASYPDCAITLSIGERSRESYQASMTRGRTAICCVTKPQMLRTTECCTRRRCPSSTGSAACGRSGRSAIRWAAG